MNLRSAARGFLAFLLSVQVLQGNADWRVAYSSSNVCALRGAMVDISCTYEYPDDVQYRPTTVTTLWFTKGDNYQPVDLKPDTDYTGRVESKCGEVSCAGSRCHGTCTLRIKELRQSDSAVYKFRFTTNQTGGEYTGDPGVTLSVTDLQVKVSFPSATDLTWTELECHSMCALAGEPRYIWFRNGKKARQGVNYRGQIPSGDNYSCAVEGYDLRSPLVYAPKTPLATVSPSGEIEEGSSVTLSCSSEANPAANYTWFKVKGPSSTNVNQGPQLVFTQILSSDSGQYYCLVQSELRQASKVITIHMKYGPKHTSVYSSRSGEIQEGSSVTLSCSSDANPAANYTWFKEHEVSVKESGQNYTITNFTSEHGGKYYCKAHNEIGHQNSTYLFIQVTSSSSQKATVAVTTIGVLLATILLLVLFWMRRNSCGQGGRPDTVAELLPAPVYDNSPALTNRLDIVAQREPIEERDDHHYASIHNSVSEEQEVPCWMAGSGGQSDKTAAFYSVVNIQSVNSVP